MSHKALFQVGKAEVSSGQSMGLDPKATMTRFIWPNDFSARLRLERSRYVRDREDSVLFVIAPSGFGKSHLLQAIAQDEIAACPAKSIIYLTAKVWNYKIRQGLSSTMLELLLAADVLLLDDASLFESSEALTNILACRAKYLKRTIVSVASRQDVMKSGLGAFFRQNMVIEFQRLSGGQIRRLIAQRARDCGMRINSRREQRLASYRYRDVVDVFTAVGEQDSRRSPSRKKQHQRA